jgi:hypothetical protein
LRGLDVGAGRIEQVLTVAIADPGRADRAVERDAGQRQRRGGAEQRRDVRIDFLDSFDMHRGDDLDFVGEALGNSGRSGRSIRRQVSVSFSDGLPSRLKKPPGMRPAA